MKIGIGTMKTAHRITITREKPSCRPPNRHGPGLLHAHIETYDAQIETFPVQLHAFGAGALGALSSTDAPGQSRTVHMQPQYAQFETCGVQIETYAAEIQTRTVQIETQNAQLRGKGPRYGRFPKSHYQHSVTFTRRKSNNHVTATTARCTISCVSADFPGVVLCPDNRKR